MTGQMARLTKVIAWLTVTITVLTAISTYWIIAETLPGVRSIGIGNPDWEPRSR
jgi:hypothetical protein